MTQTSRKAAELRDKAAQVLAKSKELRHEADSAHDYADEVLRTAKKLHAEIDKLESNTRLGQ